VGLNHGNIVQVFDFGQVDGEYFLAMELVEGQPLSKVIKKAQAMGLAQLPAPLAVNIAIEMCKAATRSESSSPRAGMQPATPVEPLYEEVTPEEAGAVVGDGTEQVK
jgi:serine/threonine-protein kinase